MRATRRLTLLGQVAVALALAGGWAATAGAGEEFAYKGITFVSWWDDQYATAEGDASLADLNATGANWVSLLVTWYMDTGASNTIARWYDSPDYLKTPTDAAVIHAIQGIHARGMKVMLKPHVDVKDGTKRHLITPSNVNDWFTSYIAFITYYAGMAQANGVDLFCAGTELKSMTSVTNQTQWNTVIDNIKAVYTGPLTYAALAALPNDEFKTVCFWSRMDLVGVDVYFALTNQADPTVEQLVAAWRFSYYGFDAVNELRNWQATVNKPVIFSEIGYQSADKTNETPWWVNNPTLDLQEQADCYEAALRVWSQESWLKGVFWWGWEVPVPLAGDIQFTPRDKPAEAVLANWYLPPTISGVSPASGSAAGGYWVTITGSRFMTYTPVTVSFGGANATSVNVTGPAEATCATPAGAPGPAEVAVTNPGGQRGALPGGYAYFAEVEADVAPRNTGGSGAPSVAAWVQVGRFATQLDAVRSGIEFQKADCAPASTQGDGQLGVADWVQAGRYAAALDPLQSAAGPVVPAP